MRGTFPLQPADGDRRRQRALPLVTSTAIPDFPRPYNGRVTVVNDADFTTRRVFEVGPLPRGIACGSGKLVVHEVFALGVRARRGWIYPLSQVSAPASVTLGTTHAAPARPSAHRP